MKKIKKLTLAIFAAIACLACSMLALVACSGETVIKVGKTDIGTVTSKGATYSVEGEADTAYKLTANVDGAASDDVLIAVGGETGTAFVVFTYTAGCEATLTAVSDDIKNVSVVMEKYEESELPEYKSYDLTANGLTVTNLKADEIIIVSFATEVGKTYTVTVGEGLSILSKSGSAATVTVNGSAYANEETNVASVMVKATKDVASATVSLSVADEEVANYPALTVGANTISGTDEWKLTQIYTLEVTASGTYSFTGIDAELILVGTEVTEGFGGSLDIAGLLEADADGNYDLDAGTTYYVGLFGDGTLTIAFAESNIPTPEVKTLTTAGLIVTNLKAGDKFNVQVATEENTTYTIKIEGEGLAIQTILGATKTTETFNGNDYVDFDNVATFTLVASADVASATISLTLGGNEGGEGDYKTLTVGANTISGTDMWSLSEIYTLEVTVSGTYSFTGIDAEFVVVGTEVTEGFNGGLDIGEVIGPDFETGCCELVAGTTYYVGLFADGTLTIALAD
ncbi:MAG: hypothetical protein K2K80_06065 [Clostridia bacterium]|nr:hypothetical protein [Clostridia bacterium]